MQYRAQIDQAVDAFLDQSQFAGRRPVSVFRLAVVLETIVTSPR
jgi:hypothetical protein